MAKIIVTVIFSIFSVNAYGSSATVAAGVAYERFSYKEELAAPDKSTETAFVPSVLIEARWHLGGGASHLRLRYETCRGVASAYDGSDLTTHAPVAATDVLAFSNYEAAAYFALSEQVFAYIGYGYRVWLRGLAGNPGYNEVYSWYYMPVGARLMIGKREHMDWGIDISVRPTTGGTIEVITSHTFDGGQDSTMNLGAKTGYRFAIPVLYRSEPWSLETALWYEHSEIGQSNTSPNATLASGANQVIFEPSSATDRIGVDAIIGYSF